MKRRSPGIGGIMPCAVALPLAAAFAAATAAWGADAAGVLASGLTAGWEAGASYCDQHVFDPTGVVWRADVSNVRMERRDGAEGRLAVADGRFVVEKTNDKGYLLVTCEPFEISSNLVVRMSADVEVEDSDPEFSYGFLRAWGEAENLVAYAAGYAVSGTLRPTPAAGLFMTPTGKSFRKYGYWKSDGPRATPALVIAGRRSRSVWSNWLFEDESAVLENWRRVRKAGEARRIECVRAERTDAEFAAFLAKDVEHTAKLAKVDGVTRLLVDGRITVPNVFKNSSAQKDRSETLTGIGLCDNGVPIMTCYVEGGTGHWRPGCPWQRTGYDAKGAVEVMRRQLLLAGDALVMVAFNCNAYPEFCDDNPGEEWLDEKGRPVYGGALAFTPQHTGFDAKNVWRWPSHASRKWRDAVNSNLRAFAAELKRTGLSKRVVAIHLLGYNDGQFGVVGVDTSVHARRDYVDYCREQAKTGGTTNYVNFCRLLGVRAVDEFAATFKKAIGKEVLAVRWSDSPFVVDFGLTAFERSPNVDVVVPQSPYGERIPCVANVTFVPYSSLNLNGKMMFNEFDLRTYSIWPANCGAVQAASYARDFEDWQTVFRKTAGEMIAARSGFWFYDMDRGYFMDPALQRDVCDVVGIEKSLIARKPSTWRPDVAFVVDEEGLLGWDGGRHTLLNHTYELTHRSIRALGGAGVPYEFFLADDVIRAPGLLDGAKCVVFFLFRNFDEKRVAMAKALARDGRTLVFTAESGTLGGSKEGTGFDVTYVNSTAKTFVVDGVHGLMDQRAARQHFGRANAAPRGERGTVAEAHGVNVLARFEDGAPAIAELKDGECRRLYFSAPGGFTPELFNRIARESGAYVPVDGARAQVNMNGDFISVHSLRNGSFAFRLPFDCRAKNLKSGLYEAVSGRKMNLCMTAGQTCWFEIVKDD